MKTISLASMIGVASAAGSGSGVFVTCHIGGNDAIETNGWPKYNGKEIERVNEKDNSAVWNKGDTYKFEYVHEAKFEVKLRNKDRLQLGWWQADFFLRGGYAMVCTAADAHGNEMPDNRWHLFSTDVNGECYDGIGHANGDDDLDNSQSHMCSTFTNPFERFNAEGIPMSQVKLGETDAENMNFQTVWPCVNSNARYPYDGKTSGRGSTRDSSYGTAEIDCKPHKEVKPGDCVVVGFATDAPDDFAVLLLEDLDVGTDLYASDNGWAVKGGSGQWFGDSEWEAHFKATTDTYLAGTVLTGRDFFTPGKANSMNNGKYINNHIQKETYNSKEFSDNSGGGTFWDIGDNLFIYKASSAKAVPDVFMCAATTAGWTLDNNLQARFGNRLQNMDQKFKLMESNLPVQLQGLDSAYSLTIKDLKDNNVYIGPKVGTKEDILEFVKDFDTNWIQLNENFRSLTLKRITYNDVRVKVTRNTLYCRYHRCYWYGPWWRRRVRCYCASYGFRTTYSWHTQRLPYKNYYYDINYHHCEGQNERQKYLNYKQDHRDDRQYVAKYNGGYTQHVRKEVKYLDGDGLQKRCADDFVQAWKNLVGMTDKGEKRFEICQHDEERKFVGGKWACVETQAPTASPTMSPTESPTPLCHKYNCASWTCEDWCECYKDEDEDFYASQDGCGDDGEDTCLCFHHEDKDGNELRDVVKDEKILNQHRYNKIKYSHDEFLKSQQK